MSPSYDVDDWLRRLPTTFQPAEACRSPSPFDRGGEQVWSVSGDTNTKRRRLDMPSPPVTNREASTESERSVFKLASRQRTSAPTSMSTSPPSASISPTKRKRHTADDCEAEAYSESGSNTAEARRRRESPDLTTPRASRHTTAGRHASSTGSPTKKGRSRGSVLSSASSSVHGSSSVVSLESRRSRGSSSPKKQAANLQIFGSVLINHGDLMTLQQSEALSPDLMNILVQLIDIRHGKSILPLDLDRDELWNGVCQTSQFKQWILEDRHYDISRGIYGPTPPPDEVQKLVDKSVDCGNRECEEPVWNLEVHQPLLDMALRAGDGNALKRLVRFSGCTTARVHKEYRDLDPEAKSGDLKVDFSIFIDPANSPLPRVAEAAGKVQKLLPNHALNHSNAFSLKDYLFAICIETKKVDGIKQEAMNQLAVWQRAHFAFLCRLRDEARRAAREVGVDVPERFEALPSWLPGLIVTGHTWHFAPATMDDGWQRMTVWFSTQPMGGTGEALEVYKAVLALQMLRKWIEDHLWPFLRDLILFILEPNLYQQAPPDSAGPILHDES